MLQSSANIDSLTLSSVSGTSFIIIKKRIGLNTEPWGVPLSNRTFSDISFPTLTWIVRSLRKSDIHLYISSRIPIFLSFWSRPSCQIMSNAFSRSIKIPTVFCLEYSDLWISSWSRMIWSIQERFRRNPDWALFRIPFFSRYQHNLFAMSRFIILHNVDVKEIGVIGGWIVIWLRWFQNRHYYCMFPDARPAFLVSRWGCRFGVESWGQILEFPSGFRMICCLHLGPISFYIVVLLASIRGIQIPHLYTVYKWGIWIDAWSALIGWPLIYFPEPEMSLLMSSDARHV